MVARRLHRAALAAGMESTLIFKYGLRGDPTPGFVALRDARLLYYLRRRSADPRLYRAGKLLRRLVEHPNLANRPAGLEVFSPLNQRGDFTNCVAAYSPDVIHLHWVNGFVDHAEFFQRNRQRRFVWTLHDMNPVTGGCHHSDGCMRFTGDCDVCPQLAGTIDPGYASQVLEAKAQILAPLRDDQLTIVAPSRWLLELSMKSRVTSRFRHVHIENPSFVMSAPAPDPAKLRAELQLPADRKIVLFASDNLRNARKGFDLLFAAGRLLPRDVHFVGIGQPTDAPSGLSITFAGAIADEEALIRYHACADLLVCASVVENAPLVVIEALTCGTPVVGFAAGGM